MATLLDTAMGAACWTVLEEDESFLTADLRVEFMRSARPGTLRAEGLVVQRNRRVAFCSGELFDADGTLPQERFWAVVGSVLDDYLGDHPEAQAAAERYGLRRAEFAHSCLNRLQLRNTLTMVDITDQAESLIFAGTLVNPVGPDGPGAPAR